MAGAISQSIYNTLFRKNASYLTAVFLGAFAFEMTFDTTVNKLWDQANAGRQWKDVKQKYMQAAEEDDE